MAIKNAWTEEERIEIILMDQEAVTRLQWTCNYMLL